MATKLRLRVPFKSVVICIILCAHVALALQPSKISILSPRLGNKGMYNKQAILGYALLPNYKSELYSSITETENEEITQKARVDNRIQNNISQQYANAISTHLENALQSKKSKKSLNNDDGDISIQSKHMEYAEQVLIQWVEQYRGGQSSSSSNENDGGLIRNEEQRQLDQVPPDAHVFSSVIEGLLALPSSFSVATIEEKNDNRDDINSSLSLLQDITESVQQKKTKKNMHRSEKNKSDRATQILDLMESFHEPPGALYDAIIASHGEDALHCLSCLTRENDIEQERTDWKEDGDESNRKNSNDSPYSQQAWKSAKLGLQLLNRAEDLYHEMGQNPSQLPSVSSYVSVMDVWKALAMSIEGVDEKKKLDEVLEVVRHVRNRRLKVYTLDQDNNDAGNTNHDNKSGFTILPEEVLTMPVQEVLLYATSILRGSEPWYKLWIEDTNKIGTWHFNQLIFDLAKYPQSFSGPLANDLLEYMMYMVKNASPPPSKQRKKKKQQQQQQATHNINVPKPNVKTINGVLKAWMVTTNHSDVARRAEAVLARLAIWQSQGILWGVSANTISYNTCMNIWKNSKVPGSAQRAQEILSLMEDESTLIQPDVISYSTSIGAWAECSSRDPSAGRRAEEILLRMYNRTRDALGDESIVAPRPTTRCFNAVFLAYANGKQKGGGKRALELLRFMERLNSEGYANLSPDTYTFNIVMKVSTHFVWT